MWEIKKIEFKKKTVEVNERRGLGRGSRRWRSPSAYRGYTEGRVYTDGPRGSAEELQQGLPSM